MFFFLLTSPLTFDLRLNVSVADAYALGLLLHAVFNPSQPPPATTVPPHPPPAATSRGAMPTALFSSFKNLLNPNPKTRLTPKAFLDIGMVETGFFATNRLIKVCTELSNFSLASETEKNALLQFVPFSFTPRTLNVESCTWGTDRTLKESASSFPAEFTSNHVLPSLISAMEYGGASVTGILPLVLQFGASVPPSDYPSIVLAPVVKLYASPDRGVRMALLDHLGEYADQLDKKTVSEKIFPHLVRSKDLLLFSH